MTMVVTSISQIHQQQCKWKNKQMIMKHGRNLRPKARQIETYCNPTLLSVVDFGGMQINIGSKSLPIPKYLNKEDNSQKKPRYLCQRKLWSADGPYILHLQDFLIANKVEIQAHREEAVKFMLLRGFRLEVYEIAILHLILLWNRHNWQLLEQEDIVKKAAQFIARKTSVINSWIISERTWEFLDCREEFKKRKNSNYMLRGKTAQRKNVKPQVIEEQQDKWLDEIMEDLSRLTPRPSRPQPITPTFVFPSRKKEEQVRNYQLVEFDKVKHVFEDVNQKWVQAQRKMEEKLGVKEQERLSRYIQVKHLSNLKICVDLPSPQKKYIQNMAEAMGAKIKNEVVDNCLLISTRNDTEKVAKAMQANNVRVLTPKFIEQCKKFNTLLNESEYYLEL